MSNKLYTQEEVTHIIKNALEKDNKISGLYSRQDILQAGSDVGASEKSLDKAMEEIEDYKDLLPVKRILKYTAVLAICIFLYGWITESKKFEQLHQKVKYGFTVGDKVKEKETGKEGRVESIYKGRDRTTIVVALRMDEPVKQDRYQTRYDNYCYPDELVFVEEE